MAALLHSAGCVLPNFRIALAVVQVTTCMTIHGGPASLDVELGWREVYLLHADFSDPLSLVGKSPGYIKSLATGED